MCGIVGYIGHRQASEVLLSGLRRLEYRGYDSAGPAVLAGQGGLAVERKAGELANLEAWLAQADRRPSRVPLRWGMPGGPPTVDRPTANAHPRRDATGKVAAVHNGIIENFVPLRARLEANGVELSSATDTGASAHLVAQAFASGLSAGDLAASVRPVCKQLVGAFTLLFTHADQPDMIVAAGPRDRRRRDVPGLRYVGIHRAHPRRIRGHRLRRATARGPHPTFHRHPGSGRRGERRPRLLRAQRDSGTTRRYRQHPAQTILFLGRHVGYPVALEGALKLKELAYLHAEAFAAGELKHGPVALIEQGLPVVVVMPSPEGPAVLYSKLLSNIQEITARGARTVAIAEEGDETIRPFAHHLLEVPAVPTLLQPLVCSVPLQVLAAEIARAGGYDVDKPRNLAKSVTVE